MNIAEYSIKNPVITWTLVILLFFGGLYSYFQLGRLEDPEFTIKDAKVITQYPGATPQEVEQEVTEKIEEAIQELGQVKEITSVSQNGLSIITVTIKDKYNKKTLPQVWDELRRKVNDVQNQLPPGASASVIKDDYGDVYGLLYAITGEGFSYKELKDYSDFLKKKLSLVPGVAKVEITGEQQEVIYISMSSAKMAQLGISLEDIANTLKTQNLVAPSGSVPVGDEMVEMIPSGNLNTVNAIGNTLIRSKVTQKLLHLNDVATISRSYKEIPSYLLYYNGKPALGLGVSILPGENVLKVGDALKQQAKDLSTQIPYGIELHPIYEQPKAVEQAVNGFVVSLVEALIIVIAVLLFFMGFRSGLIIGVILLLTVMGTLLFMNIFSINLERISLGALIIALGMLVDNAIVVAEGIVVKTDMGEDTLTSAKEVVSKTQWPLFGATIIGILAFAGIGLSQDSTGEYTASLFYVILISLMLSWVLAITVTPLLCHLYLTPNKNNQNASPYDKPFYKKYQQLLTACLNHRGATLFVTFLLLILSLIGFTFVKKSFFPNSTTPLFYVDYWKPQGTDIRATAKSMLALGKKMKNFEGITNITNSVGGGLQRFMLVYTPEDPNTAYGQFIIEVTDYKKIDAIAEKVLHYLETNDSNSQPKIDKVRLGPGGGDKIEARFTGENPKTLRDLSNKAQAIMAKEENAVDIKDDWRQKVKLLEPQYSEQQARLTGITRWQLSDTLAMAFSGKPLGLYREQDELIPIVIHPPENERWDVSSLGDIQIWSPLLQAYVPIGHVVSQTKVLWKDSLLHRRDRQLTITASCNPKTGVANDLFQKLKPQIESIPLPKGYSLTWGGEYEDSHDAQSALAAKLPLTFLSMFLILILLFKSLKRSLVIALSVPLSLVGVTFGLLVTHEEFGFMALLGFLSLTGMLIKNAIVLVDEMDIEIAQGKKPYDAIVHSSVSRVRPVCLAAVTTVLGMIPLLPDAFFASMSVVIMFGLTFATVLTLFVVPLFYSFLFTTKTSA